MLFIIEIGYQHDGDDQVYYKRYVTEAWDMKEACTKCIKVFEDGHPELGVKSISGDTLNAEIV